MEVHREFDSAQKAISAALIAATRSTSRIAAEDVNFHRSSNTAVARSIEQEGTRLLSLADKLLYQSSRLDGRVRVRLRELETTNTHWKAVVDELDYLLERTDIALDEYAGYFRKRKGDSRDSSPIPKRTRVLPREFRPQVITKPQLSFNHKPFNHDTRPFRPILLTKPHAHIDINSSLRIISDGGFAHPYQHEINNYDYPHFVYESAVPITPAPFKSTQAIFVDSVGDLHAMLDELRVAREIAVDLEHHDTHSYIGMVSLMQISTRKQDWIIDTLRPWRRELEALNEVFTDPTILKVLHGAQMDIIWLQRDFGLYVVGLFDTYHASRSLGYPGHSLAYLLKRFAGFEAQKQYQTADWRIRPLPSELFDYARSDTHFLLYIYDNMRNELVQDAINKRGNKIHDVLQASQKYALQRYEHSEYCTLPTRSHNGWFSQLLKLPANLTNTQLVAFRKLHEWRDKVGRDEDESTNYVLPNFVLQNVARSLPTNAADLLSIVGTPSHVARARASELVDIVLDSLHNSSTGTDIKRDLEAFHNTQHRWQTKQFEPDPETSSAANEIVTTYPDTFRAATSHFWGPATADEDLDKLSALPDSFDLTLEINIHEPEISTHLGDEKILDRPKRRKADGFDKHLTKTDSGTQERSSVQPLSSSFPQIKAQARSSQETDMRIKKLVQEPKQASDTTNQELTFDYVNEPAVTRIEGTKDSRPKLKGTRESFNPFAKAAEVQGGLGRAQSSRSGRTATFTGKHS